MVRGTVEPGIVLISDLSVVYLNHSNVDSSRDVRGGSRKGQLWWQSARQVF